MRQEPVTHVRPIRELVGRWLGAPNEMEAYSRAGFDENACPRSQHPQQRLSKNHQNTFRIEIEQELKSDSSALGAF